MKSRSLVGKLYRSILSPIILAIFVIGIAGYYCAIDEIADVYDSEMITEANMLWLVEKQNPIVSKHVISLKPRVINLENIDRDVLDLYSKLRSFRIWRNNRLIVTSVNARPEKIPHEKQGFSRYSYNGYNWRSFTMYIPEEKAIVEVSEKEGGRENLIRSIAESLVIPLLFILPIISLLLFRGVKYGLRDLGRYAENIKCRNYDDLRRIEPMSTPTELLPLTEGLNQLLEKLESAIVHERNFMDNAAHELRTPLAALQIQLALVRNSKTDSEREVALENLENGIARSAKLIEQMLLLGKNKNNIKKFEEVNLYNAATICIKNVALIAVQKNINLSLIGDKSIKVNTQEDLLVIALGNIIDNAIKYTPNGGEVKVIVVNDNNIKISVVDSGYGIPSAELENVFERFYRLKNQYQEGSGLGLAIVRHIADMLKIKVTLRAGENEKGLVVDLIF